MANEHEAGTRTITISGTLEIPDDDGGAAAPEPYGPILSDSNALTLLTASPTIEIDRYRHDEGSLTMRLSVGVELRVVWAPFENDADPEAGFPDVSVALDPKGRTLHLWLMDGMRNLLERVEVDIAVPSADDLFTDVRRTGRD